MQQGPASVRFNDQCKLCDHCFGAARQRRTSHRVYRTPWQGDPRVNIQCDRGKAKAYQVLRTIERLEKLGG